MLTIQRWVFWVWFKLHGYYLLARAWRALFQRSYRNIPIPLFHGVDELEAVLFNMAWKADRLNGMLDIVDHPGKVQWALDHHKGDGKAAVGDCDEFAIYACRVIADMIEHRHEPLEGPWFVSHTWVDTKGSHHGHNICVYFDVARGKYAHIGNWHSGEARGGFGSILQCVMDFVGPGKLIGYAAATPDLKKLHKLELGEG